MKEWKCKIVIIISFVHLEIWKIKYANLNKPEKTDTKCKNMIIFLKWKLEYRPSK